MIFTQPKASQVSKNAHSWTVGNDSLSGTFYTFCRPCKSPERTGDVAEWKNTCLACTRLWVQSPTLHKRTPKCQDDEPPFTGEMRKLSLREVTLSAEFQGKEGTEPGWVRTCLTQSPLGRAESCLQLLTALPSPFGKEHPCGSGFSGRVCVHRLVRSCRHMCGCVKLARCLVSQNHVIKIWYIFLRCQFHLNNKAEQRCHIFTEGTDGCWLPNVREQGLLVAC